MNLKQRLPLLFVLFSLSSLYAAGAPEAQTYDIKASRSGSLREQLTLEFTETKRSQNACDQHVKRFEYSADAAELRLEFGSEPCLVDRVGHRRAQFSWTLPRSLRKGSKEIHLQVEGRKIGVLRFDNRQVEVTGVLTERSLN